MSVEISFKERVKNTAINESKNYKSIFIDYEYLVCSQVFSKKDFYIISANEDNYLHLIGINSSLRAKDFFDKCHNGTLQETDFDFIKSGQPENSVKGTVRRKINVLGNMMTLFNKPFYVQEQFTKNNVVCSFATADYECTVGFIDVGKSIPRSLINGNGLDETNKGSVDLLLRKKKTEHKFNEIILGDIEMVKKYSGSLETLIDESSLAIGINQMLEQVAIHEKDKK